MDAFKVLRADVVLAPAGENGDGWLVPVSPGALLYVQDTDTLYHQERTDCKACAFHNHQICIRINLLHTTTLNCGFRAID